MTSDSGLTHQPAISPDGKLVAYSSDRASPGAFDIYVQQIGAVGAIRRTVHAANDREPTFSPDGESIVFVSDRDGGGTYIMDALVGEPDYYWKTLFAGRNSRRTVSTYRIVASSRTSFLSRAEKRSRFRLPTKEAASLRGRFGCETASV